MKNPRILGSVFAALTIACGCATPGVAQCVIEMTRPAPPTSIDYFGVTGSLDGDYVLVGAYNDDTVRDGAGAVHVFNAADGAFIRTLYPPNVGDTHFFGQSIACDDGTALIGASAAQPTSAAYLVDIATGATLHTFSLPVGYTGLTRYGQSVHIDSDRLYVSAKGRLADPGAVFVYDRATYALLHVLESPTGDPDDEFGEDFVVSADRVVVSAYRADDQAFDAGAVYLYDRQTGAYLDTVVATGGDNVDRFGWAIALEGDTLVVSAPGYDEPFLTENGAVFVFDLSNGVEEIDVYYSEDGVLPVAGFSLLNGVLIYPFGPVEARSIPTGDLLGWIEAPSSGPPEVQGFGAFISEDSGRLLIGSNGTGVSPGPVSVFLYPNGVSALPGDVTRNGCVDSEDLAALLASWGTMASDLDGDGVAGASDLALLLAAWSN